MIPGLMAALCTSILSSQVYRASVEDGIPLLPPLPSPDGLYLLSPYMVPEAEGMSFWSIVITDTTGMVLMSDLGPIIVDDLCSTWDEMGRAWIYSENLLEIRGYGMTPSGWAEVYNRSQWSWGLDDGFVAPYNLYSLAPWNRNEDPPEMLPGYLSESSGPGWEMSYSYPSIPSDLSFLRRLIREVMRPKTGWFVSEAESSFAEWGDDPNYTTWSLEISTSLPCVPEGMFAVEFDWWDYTGGVHGNSGSECWLFGFDRESTDTPPWTLIGTEDLLADSAELVTLSALVVDSLAKFLGESADMDWIMRGAGPEWHNYSDLMPVADSTGALAGFRIWFPDYSVAPYVAGPQEVFIPIELLRP